MRNLYAREKPKADITANKHYYYNYKCKRTISKTSCFKKRPSKDIFIDISLLWKLQSSAIICILVWTSLSMKMKWDLYYPEYTNLNSENLIDFQKMLPLTFEWFDFIDNGNNSIKYLNWQLFMLINLHYNDYFFISVHVKLVFL